MLGEYLLPAGLHHAVDDGREASALASVSVHSLGAQSALTQHEVRLHGALAFDLDQAPFLRFVPARLQKLQV